MERNSYALAVRIAVQDYILRTRGVDCGVDDDCAIREMETWEDFRDHVAARIHRVHPVVYENHGDR